jgi:hypothetical protein
MSTETSELNQPNDGGDSEEPRWRFGFRHADTGVDDADRDAATADDADEMAGTAGTVYDSTDSADGQPVVGDRDEDVVDPHPTFTPADDDPAATLPSPRETDEGRVVQGQVVSDPDDVTAPDVQPAPYAEPAMATVDDTTAASVPVSEPVPVADSVPVVEPLDGVGTVPASGTTAPPAVAFDPSAPLLGDPVALRASWQQAAAEFVDDPRAAVADAAELVEQTAQTLIGALQQRQRQMRGQWETGTNGSVDSASGASDTEELRLLMRNYRSLFNQLTSL